MEEIYAIAFIIIMFYISSRIFKRFIFPKLIESDTKELERNPKWIMGELNKNKYYGFQDIDIILAETKLFYSLPRFRVTKNNRYELWISNDTTTREVDNILRFAIISKIYVKYGLFFPDEPLHWLSILCYMLDGGDINEAATVFEEKKS